MKAFETYLKKKNIENKDSDICFSTVAEGGLFLSRLDIRYLPDRCKKVIDNCIVSEGIKKYKLEGLNKSTYDGNSWFVKVRANINETVLLKITAIPELDEHLESYLDWKCQIFNVQKEQQKNLIKKTLILIQTIVYISLIFMNVFYWKNESTIGFIFAAFDILYLLLANNTEISGVLSALIDSMILFSFLSYICTMLPSKILFLGLFMLCFSFIYFCFPNFTGVVQDEFYTNKRTSKPGD